MRKEIVHLWHSEGSGSGHDHKHYPSRPPSGFGQLPGEMQMKLQARFVDSKTTVQDILRARHKNADKRSSRQSVSIDDCEDDLAVVGKARHSPARLDEGSAVNQEYHNIIIKIDLKCSENGQPNLPTDRTSGLQKLCSKPLHKKA